MAKIEELTTGKRVRITVEGVLRDDVWESASKEQAGSTLVALEIHWDGMKPGRQYDYVDITDLPLSAVEVVKEPLKNGLYYYGNSDKAVDQMSLVYKLEDGVWYDNRLNVIELDDDEISRFVPLVRGES